MSVCESWAWQLRLLRATHRARGWRGNTVALCALVCEYEERHGEEVVCTSRVPKGVFYAYRNLAWCAIWSSTKV